LLGHGPLSGQRIAVEQPLNNALPQERLSEDLRHIIRRDPNVHDVLGADNDLSLTLAEAQTSRLFERDSLRNAQARHFLLEGSTYVLAPAGDRAGSAADSDAALPGLALFREVLLELPQVCWRFQPFHLSCLLASYPMANSGQHPGPVYLGRNRRHRVADYRWPPRIDKIYLAIRPEPNPGLTPSDTRASARRDADMPGKDPRLCLAPRNVTHKSRHK